MNYAAIDNAISGIEQINYPESWADTKEGADKFHVPATKYFDTVVHPILAQKGDSLPVSTFDPSGYVPTGTTQYEKRGIAVNLPEWIPENCIQCNQCALVCPHACIRPVLIKNDAPADFCYQAGNR